MNNLFKKAFTLAEVLIALAIIGVVAALTIPNVVRNYQKTQYVSSAMKALNTMQQGLKQMATNEGCTNLDCTGLFTEGDTTDSVWNDKFDIAVKKAFKVVRSYKNGSDKTSISYPVKFILVNRKIDNYFANEGYNFITADGVLFAISYPKCSKTKFSNISKYKKNCLFVAFDTNGIKPPNQFGKDVFGDIRFADDFAFYPATSYEWSMATYGHTDVGSQYWRVTPSQCGVANATHEATNFQGSGQNCLPRVIEEGLNITYF